MILHLFRRLGAVLLWLVVAICLIVTIVPPFLDHLYYRGPVSDHFDGRRFFNPEGEKLYAPPTTAARTSFITRLLGGGDVPSWPERVAVTPARPAPRVADMRVVWVGHATTLIQAGGANILTDPVWSDIVSPVPPIGPRRVAPPGIRFADLPRIDIVVLSHNHYDHFDIATLKRLWRRDRPKIYVPLGNDTILRAAGIESVSLDWGQSAAGPAGVRVTAVRVHHWDSRWGVDRNRALWAGYVLATGAGNILFAGDTGPGDMRWPAEARRFGPFRLAMLSIGAFRFSPGQMVNANHLGPREALQAFVESGAAWGLPIHWGTFHLSSEGYATPPRMLALFERCAGIDPARFQPKRIGESWDVPPLSAVTRGRPTIDPAMCRDGSPALATLK